MGANKSCSTGNNDSQEIKPPGQVFFQRRNELDPLPGYHIHCWMPLNHPGVFVCCGDSFLCFMLECLLPASSFIRRFGAIMVTKRALPSPVNLFEGVLSHGPYPLTCRCTALPGYGG